jgi:hypothetical protein
MIYKVIIVDICCCSINNDPQFIKHLTQNRFYNLVLNQKQN